MAGGSLPPGVGYDLVVERLGPHHVPLACAALAGRSRRPPPRSYRRWAVAGVAGASFVAGLATPAAAAAPGPSTTPPAARAASGSGTFTCNLVGKEIVTGTPDVAAHAVPAIRSVQLTPYLGGLLVRYRFRPGFALAPEGVYFAWSVYVYRHRADANNSVLAVQLQIEDRGKGWEPSGWSVLASTYYQAQPVAGQVRTDKARDEIATYFPAGFVNLKPPFYWYASQEVFRGYLPKKSKTAHQDWSVNGSIVNDCPSGVRSSAFSLPYAAKLLTAQ